MIGSAKRTSPIGGLLVLACALVILVAALAMPWLSLEDGSTATAYKLIADTGRSLEVPARITNTFLIIVPVAALVAAGLALWGLVSPREDRTISRLTLLVGLMLVGYYFGTFFYEDHVNAKTAAADFTRSGFYVALAAGVGLIVLAALQQTSGRTRPNPVESVGVLELPRNWRLPFAWLRAQLSRYARRVTSYLQLGRIPVLAYLVGLLAATELERREGGAFARLVGFRRTPSLFGSTELLEPFSKLDFSGILAPMFPSPSDKFEAPL
ncbi:MAG: hypothetical protein AB1435_03555, partial [Chloroflexota bacterium]